MCRRAELKIKRENAIYWFCFSFYFSSLIYPHCFFLTQGDFRRASPELDEKLVNGIFFLYNNCSVNYDHNTIMDQLLNHLVLYFKKDDWRAVFDFGKSKKSVTKQISMKQVRLNTYSVS